MTAGAQPSKFHILIAEDNAADVLLLKEVLREHEIPYHADVASDGEKAFAFLQRFEKGPGKLLDLVLLDLNLGTHHGADVLAYIRSMPDLRHVPVIVLTSSDSPFDRERVRALGANLYIRKPLDLDAFLRIGGEIAAVLG